MEMLSARLDANRERLTRALRWPENIGMIFRDLTIASEPPTGALLIWVEGLASVEAVEMSVIKPLTLPPRVAHVRSLTEALPAPQREVTRELGLLLHRVMEGWTALLVNGFDEALLLETTSYHQQKAGSMAQNPNIEVFGADLRGNVALMRKRLRMPGLLALPVPLRRPKSGFAALVYKDGQASQAVVRHLSRWGATHIGEEAGSRGVIAGLRAVFGLVPRFEISLWPDQAAMLVDSGYVALFIDRLPRAHIAPVTLAGVVLSPSDLAIRYPLKRWLNRIRIFIYLLVMLLPGAVVAVVNYHQEMVPTAFILSIASARENSPFPVFFEVLLLELVTDLVREASFRLPGNLPIGSAVIITVLVVVLAVLTGFVGPLPALATVIGAIASIALPSFAGAYLARAWRFLFILAGVTLGFFGMAALFAWLVAHLCQATSWGVPFFGPSGAELTAREAPAARAPEQKGGRRRATGQAQLR